MSAADFARHLGVSRHTLAWWRWRLKPTHTETSEHAPLRFVQLDVEPDRVAPESAHDWVFTSAAGHSLRVRGAIDPAARRLVLRHMTAERAR